MSYEMYRMLFVGGAIMTGVMLIVTVLLFFVLRIPRVIGDLTGSNARKGIESIRNQNSSSGSGRTYKAKRTPSADRMTGKIEARTLSENGGLRNTERIAVSKVPQVSADETTVLGASDNETTLLDATASETTVLVQEESAPPVAPTVPPVSYVSATDVFVIEREITLVHTNEII